MVFGIAALAFGLTALAPGGGVALSGDRVLFSGPSEVLAAPLSGGSPSVFGGVRADALSADSGVVAARSGDALFVAGLDGRFARVSPDLGEAPLFGATPQVQATAAGVLALEDGGAYLRVGGRRVEVAVPPGADPSKVAGGGGLGVAVVPEGALVVFDLRSGV